MAVSAALTLVTAPAFSQNRRVARSTKKTAPAEPVDLNDASEDELRAVPGITARNAKKIVEGRPYSSLSDLSKAGLSQSTIRRIGKNITVAGQPIQAAREVAAGGGPGMVWVSPGSKVYHSPGDKWYGKTKNGKYMKESDAIAAGYRSSKER